MNKKLQSFISEEIEKKYSIPQEITIKFFEGEKLPYFLMKIYQQFFNAHSFTDFLDDNLIEEYLLDEDICTSHITDDEIIARDNCIINLGVENGYIIKFDRANRRDDGSLKIIKFNNMVFPALIFSSNPEKTVFVFAKDYYDVSLTLPNDKITIIGTAESYRKPSEIRYRDFEQGL